jgi:predicted DNA binding CopG/RHH family protein
MKTISLKETIKALSKEARQWEKEIAEEKLEQTARLLEEAEPFVAHRPPRLPVSLRLDPRDLSLAKRIARGKGIPFTQLMAMWLHERISREESNALKKRDQTFA